MPIAQPDQISSPRIVLQIILVSLILMAPALYLGHIVGHSSVLNVNWAHGFEQQLAQGTLYPRWLPDMNGGAGSPVFYFYGPLPFYVAAPFVALTGNEMLGVVLGSTTMLAASGLAAYMMCSLYASRKIALLAATLYLMLPYHFSVDIWYRSAFGEQAAFIFMPLSAYFAVQTAKDWRNAIGLSFSFAGQVFSHLPTALLFAPVLVLLCLWVARQARSIRTLIISAIAGILAIGLAAIYILPAATLQVMIQPDYWRVIAPADHLLLTDKMQEDFSFFMFPQGLMLVLALYLCFVALRHRAAAGLATFWAAIVVAVLFFTSILSQPFWTHAGPFNMVQLPWRLFCVLDLAVIVLFAQFMEAKLVSAKWLLPAFAITIVLGLAVAGGAQYLYYHLGDDPTLMTIENDRERVALRADASEYLPNCLDQSHDEYQAMTYRRIAANKLLQPEAGLVPIYYYPFLEATSGGTPIATTCDPKTGFMRFDPAAGQGPIVIQPKSLPIECTGGMISLASLLILLGIGFWSLRRNRS